MLSTGSHNPGHVIPQKLYNELKGDIFTACCIQIFSSHLQSWWVSDQTIPPHCGALGHQIATPGRLLEHLERCALLGTCWEWRWSFLFLGKPPAYFQGHLFWEAHIVGLDLLRFPFCSTQAFNAFFRLFPPLDGAVKNGHNRTYLFPTLFDKLQTFDRASGQVGRVAGMQVGSYLLKHDIQWSTGMIYHNMGVSNIWIHTAIININIRRIMRITIKHSWGFLFFHNLQAKLSVWTVCAMVKRWIVYSCRGMDSGVPWNGTDDSTLHPIFDIVWPWHLKKSHESCISYMVCPKYHEISEDSLAQNSIVDQNVPPDQTLL